MAQAERIPPHNDEAEKSVLGAILMDKEVFFTVSDIVKAEDFYAPAHQEIFRSMTDLYQQEAPIDIVTVSECLIRRKSLEAVGGRAYIALLSIPAYIYEREPHTDAGVFYIPLEFDATVGGWSDMIYYNILPYDIEHHSYHNAYNGTMTLVFECLETKSEDELKNWDWQKSLSIPKAKDEGGQ